MVTKKKTAILLAVLFGFWTWLYTYKRDAWKFWLVMGIDAVGFLLILGLWQMVNQASKLPRDPRDDSIGMLAVSALVVSGGIVVIWGFASWLPAVVDTIIKSQERYDASGEKSRKLAVLFAVLFGPFAYLYTYGRDKVKFWLSLGTIAASIILIPMFIFLVNNLSFNLRRLIEGKMPFSLFQKYLSEMPYGKAYDYYSGHIQPISFLIPAAVWAVAIALSVARCRIRDNNLDVTDS